MYLQFRWPEHSGAHPVTMDCALRTELNHWARQYGIAFRIKHHKWTTRVTFDQDSLYDFFRLSWRPRHENRHVQAYLTNYSLIEPMRRV